MPALGADAAPASGPLASTDAPSHLLLLLPPPVQASQLHFRNGQAQGFALFTLGSQARAAVDALHNLVFDDTAVLRAEMAHKNMCVLVRPWLGLEVWDGAHRLWTDPLGFGWAAACSKQASQLCTHSWYLRRECSCPALPTVL